MVGELDLSVAGHQAKVAFLSDQAIVSFANYASAIRISRTPLPHLGFAGKLLKFSDIRLKAKIGRRKPFELFPQPNLMLRWLSPALRSLVDD